MSGPTVVGAGNDWRGDDAAGLLVARSLRATLSDVRVLELDGDPGMLLDAWAGAQEAIVIDAVQSGAAPGMIHRLDVAAGPLPAGLRRGSTQPSASPRPSSSRGHSAVCPPASSSTASRSAGSRPARA